jgi:Eukaryotic phosphomannomutase
LRQFLFFLAHGIGSDLPKQEEQLGHGIVDRFEWNFSQNGLVAYRHGKLLEVQTISKFLGEDNIKRIVNWTMKYLADLDLPIKVHGVSCEQFPPVASSISFLLVVHWVIHPWVHRVSPPVPLVLHCYLK